MRLPLEGTVKVNPSSMLEVPRRERDPVDPSGVASGLICLEKFRWDRITRGWVTEIPWGPLIRRFLQGGEGDR